WGPHFHSRHAQQALPAGDALRGPAPRAVAARAARLRLRQARASTPHARCGLRRLRHGGDGLAQRYSGRVPPFLGLARPLRRDRGSWLRLALLPRYRALAYAAKPAAALRPRVWRPSPAGTAAVA